MLVKNIKSYHFGDNSYTEKNYKNVAVHFELEETEDLRKLLEDTIKNLGKTIEIKDAEYYLDIFFNDKNIVTGKKVTWTRIDCVFNSDYEYELPISKSEERELLYIAIDYLSNNQKGV